MLAAGTVANIKIRKTPQFAIFGTHVIYVGFPLGITFPREDCRPRASPSSDNPLSGKLFLVETPHGYHICIVANHELKFAL